MAFYNLGGMKGQQRIRGDPLHGALTGEVLPLLLPRGDGGGVAHRVPPLRALLSSTWCIWLPSWRRWLVLPPRC